MLYKNAREERKEIFNDTRQLYERNGKLIEAVKHSKKYQIIIAESDNVPSVAHGIYDIPAKVIVSKKRSLEASKGYPEQKVCVLNFASASNPGGGVENGSNAQEEAICRCSTLFPCISDPGTANQFHNKHRRELKAGRMTALYNDDCIYTPDVVAFKTDTAHPELMPETEWYKIDVISCAAPNLRSKPSNAMNPCSGDKAVTLTAGELLNLHMKRLGRIFDIAKANGAEVMILGAFGCGAFQNPPEVVAEAMARVSKEYLYDFRTIEFAVYCPPKDTRNYDIFSGRLSQINI